ncbi:hypothetical protein KAW18_13900 [candidate division WOR-3 bacterium]|nr:hypothetical protein [candidate division WOR-3 bacterium]
MRDKRIASGLILILGIIGTFVAVLSIPDVALKYTAFVGCLLISITALYFFISAYIDIGTAFRNLKAIKELKVHRLYTDGASANERIRVAVREAKTIRIIVVSGEGLVKVLKNEIIYALQKNAASIRVLLATANSDFVSDVEESAQLGTRAIGDGRNWGHPKDLGTPFSSPVSDLGTPFSSPVSKGIGWLPKAMTLTRSSQRCLI